MAATIYHGPPGSYKTASALWFDVIPALKSGRLVVTNIEGLKPIEDIEDALNIEFPTSAKLWRLSTQSSAGMALMRRWFHWLPVGALLVIDEVQQVFPKKTSFSLDKYDRTGSIYKLKDSLPPQWFSEHLERLSQVKNEGEGSQLDDLGEAEFDENGHIIYPDTALNSLMRHRKYNWDILVCTPNIRQVHPVFREATEVAYCYSNKDSIAKVFPWYKRNPRILQHNPESNGNTVNKTDIVLHRRIPVDVHKAYKSTATGKITSSGASKTPFSSPAVLASFGVSLLCFCYVAYTIPSLFSSSDIDQTSKKTDSMALPKTQPISTKNNHSNRSHDVNQAITENAISIKLPHKASHIELTGVQTIYNSGQVVHREYTFTLHIEQKEYSINSDTLDNFGYQVRYISDCLVQLQKNGAYAYVICSPNLVEMPEPETLQPQSIL